MQGGGEHHEPLSLKNEDTLPRWEVKGGHPRWGEHEQNKRHDRLQDRCVPNGTGLCSWCATFMLGVGRWQEMALEKHLDPIAVVTVTFQLRWHSN